MKDLSILIPSRNEMFLERTVLDILSNISADTEVLAAVDGPTEYPFDVVNDAVKVLKFDQPVGQRKATNELAKIAQGKYLMKIDAHCAFDRGFDEKMIKEMHDNWTMVPTMRNLHAFDWVCKNGHRRYQSPSGPCTVCKEETVRDIVWIAKESPQSNAYRFDTEMHFQYWPDFARKQKGDITETMSLQGSCFMVTKDKYFELDLCSEQFNSWGQQGVEVACKTWLSGGRVMVNRKTWYAHMFRTQGGDFSFPYENPQSKVVENRKLSRELFADNKWPKAKHKFQWLIDKFNPPGWEKNLSKGAVYYTDNRLDPKIMKACQKNLKKVFKGRIVSVSLKPVDLGENIVLPLERGYLTMAQQVLVGLEGVETDIVYLCEHDVLYHKSHFDFTPEKKDVYYYNINSWMLRATDGHALFYDHRSLSGMCGYRETLIKYFKERIRRIELLMKEANGGQVVKATSGNTISLREAIHRLGFEPGTHRRPERIDDLPAENYESEYPNVDIKHDRNLTHNRWSIDQFRNKPKIWIEQDEIPWWGRVKEKYGI